MVTALMASFIVTALWILAHLVAMHIRPAKARMAAMAKAWLISLPVLFLELAFLNNYVGIALNRQESPWLSYFYALVLHLLLFFLFVECFYHIERSVTLRLLVEIETAAGGNSSITAIMKGYSVDDMIQRRLDILARSGFASKTGDRWVLSSKGKRLAGIMSFSCWIFQSKPQNERL